LIPDFLKYQIFTMLSIAFLYFLDKIKNLAFWVVFLVFTLAINNYLLVLSLYRAAESGVFAYITIGTGGHALSWASISLLFDYLAANALLKNRRDLPYKLTGSLRFLAFAASAHESIWYLFYAIKYPQFNGVVELVAEHYWLFLVDALLVLTLFYKGLKPSSQVVLAFLTVYMFLWFTAFGFRVSSYRFGPSPYAEDPSTNTVEVLSWVIPLWGSALISSQNRINRVHRRFFGCRTGCGAPKP
jgi:hypothetical protein